MTDQTEAPTEAALSPEKGATIEGLVRAVQTAVDSMDGNGMGGWKEVKVLRAALLAARLAGLTKEQNHQ